MKAAPSSWWTSTKRTLSWWRRKPSMSLLMPSPGRPNTVSTPQPASRSTSSSDAILSTRSLLSRCAARWPSGPAPPLVRLRVRRQLGELQLRQRPPRAVDEALHPGQRRHPGEDSQHEPEDAFHAAAPLPFDRSIVSRY